MNATAAISDVPRWRGGKQTYPSRWQCYDFKVSLICEHIVAHIHTNSGIEKDPKNSLPHMCGCVCVFFIRKSPAGCAKACPKLPKLDGNCRNRKRHTGTHTHTRTQEELYGICKEAFPNFTATHEIIYEGG